MGNLESLRYATQAEPPRRTYVYDGLNRLKQVKDGASNAVLQAYDYDATGNRISATDAGVTTAYAYATDSHHLLSVGGETRGYDVVGNTLRIERSAASGGGDDGSDPYPGGGDPGPGDPGPGDPGSGTTQNIGAATADAMTATVAALREFTYDASNRMRQVKVNGAVAMTCLYNAIGERVYKSGGGTGVTTLHDESGHWIGDYDVNGQPIQQAIWMDDLPVGLLVGAGANQKLYYIEADALGTPRVVIDPDRNVAVWRWDLAGEAFGNDTPNEDPDGDGTAFVFDMRFPGQRYDSAAGMNYNYFRDYDPSMGRYTQSDPIGLAGGLSTYGYVGGNPVGLIDPLGLCPKDCSDTPASRPHHIVVVDSYSMNLATRHRNFFRNPRPEANNPGAMVVIYEVRDRTGQRITGTHYWREHLSVPAEINNTEGWSHMPKIGQIYDYQDLYSPERAKKLGIDNSSKTVYQYFDIKDEAGCVVRVPTTFGVTFDFLDGNQVAHRIVQLQEYRPTDF